MTESKEIKSRAQSRFGRFSEGYVQSASHAAGSDLDRLLELAEPSADWIGLDVATGGGHTALKFAPHLRRVVSSDLTPRMLARARDHIAQKGAVNLSFAGADAEALPFADATFDLVTCRIAPHHFPDVAQFAREAARVLKPGGRLLTQDHVLPDDREAGRWIDDFERLRDPSHHRAFTESEWRAMFENAGLDVDCTEVIRKTHGFVSWAERQGCSVEVIDELVAMMREGPAIARDWVRPTGWGTPDATFDNCHLLIRGVKGGGE